jgi:prepilin-type N-terminal cleavage/methylation domain-containing protein
VNEFLGNKKGFTLIELMVVVAIIAILVIIVIVAINPAQRVNDSSDRRAASNVRAGGTLIATCVARNQGSYASCNTTALVEGASNINGKLPTTSSFTVAASNADICLSEAGKSGTTWYYRQTTGQVASTTAAFFC